MIQEKGGMGESERGRQGPHYEGPFRLGRGVWILFCVQWGVSLEC